MRDMTPEEVAAMWLWSAEYARSGVGAIEWWAHIQRTSPQRTRNVHDLVAQMRKALGREVLP